MDAPLPVFQEARHIPTLKPLFTRISGKMVPSHCGIHLPTSKAKDEHPTADGETKFWMSLHLFVSNGCFPRIESDGIPSQDILNFTKLFFNDSLDKWH